MTNLVNRYDADAWGIGEHGINLQKRLASETMASYFDTEVDLRSVSSSNTAERSESNHLPGGTAIVATNTLCGYIKCPGKDFQESRPLVMDASGRRSRPSDKNCLDLLLPSAYA